MHHGTIQHACTSLIRPCPLRSGDAVGSLRLPDAGIALQLSNMHLAYMCRHQHALNMQLAAFELTCRATTELKP